MQNWLNNGHEQAAIIFKLGGKIDSRPFGSALPSGAIPMGVMTRQTVTMFNGAATPCQDVLLAEWQGYENHWGLSIGENLPTPMMAFLETCGATVEVVRLEAGYEAHLFWPSWFDRMPGDPVSYHFDRDGQWFHTHCE